MQQNYEEVQRFSSSTKSTKEVEKAFHDSGITLENVLSFKNACKTFT
jgi:hypothetical protein